MWYVKAEILKEDHTTRFQLMKEGNLLTVAQVLALWEENKIFQQFYNSIIADLSFAAVFWEHPAWTNDQLEDPYEFVVIKAPFLARVTAEPHTFAEHYQPAQSVLSFPNLGGSAQLVVPAPVEDLSFAHLSAFTRSADLQLISTFWQSVAIAVKKRMNQVPMWLSTAGMGVFWVHVRLDQRPKYYRHQTYKNHPFL